MMEDYKIKAQYYKREAEYYKRQAQLCDDLFDAIEE